MYFFSDGKISQYASKNNYGGEQRKEYCKNRNIDQNYFFYIVST